MQKQTVAQVPEAEITEPPRARRFAAVVLTAADGPESALTSI